MFGIGTKGESAADYATVVDRVVTMTEDRKVQALARKHKLNVLNVTWEDTGRFKGSAVGPKHRSRPHGKGGAQFGCQTEPCF